MNRHQREKNRATARLLASNARVRRNSAHVCENCGEFGGHWVSMGVTLADIMNGTAEDRGFWTCAKMYGADGRRLDTSDSPFPPILAALAALEKPQELPGVRS